MDLTKLLWNIIKLRVAFEKYFSCLFYWFINEIDFANSRNLMIFSIKKINLTREMLIIDLKLIVRRLHESMIVLSKKMIALKVCTVPVGRPVLWFSRLARWSRNRPASQGLPLGDHRSWWSTGKDPFTAIIALNTLSINTILRAQGFNVWTLSGHALSKANWKTNRHIYTCINILYVLLSYCLSNLKRVNARYRMKRASVDRDRDVGVPSTSHYMDSSNR